VWGGGGGAPGGGGGGWGGGGGGGYPVGITLTLTLTRSGLIRVNLMAVCRLLLVGNAIRRIEGLGLG